MALHGDIKINGKIIGAWTARRLQHPPQEVNEYEIAYAYFEPDGTVHQVEGTLTHRFGDGATSLAAEVLAWAAKSVPPRT